MGNECVSEFSWFETSAKRQEKLPRGIETGAYIKNASLGSEL